MDKRDYYDVLGVSRNASGDELKKAYRRKARELHPDQNKDKPGAAEEFKAVNEAYDVLKDPSKKQVYDQFGHDGLSSAGASSGFSASGDFGSVFSDVFGDIFGDFMGGGRSRASTRAARGADLRYDLRINLAEAFTGTSKTVTVQSSAACKSCDGKGTEGGVVPQQCPTCSGSGKVRAQQGFFTIERTCPTCQGVGRVIRNPCTNCAGAGRVKEDRTIKIEVPPGVDTGTRIRLAGRGDAGMRGGGPGDLYVFVDIPEHEVFSRNDSDLYCRMPIAMTTAALGGEIEVPTISGERTKVKILPGSQSGRRMRLAGKGMPGLKNPNLRGDMFIELFVETPVNLSSKQKDLLREFEKGGKNNSPESASVFSKVKRFWDDVSS